MFSPSSLKFWNEMNCYCWDCVENFPSRETAASFFVTVRSRVIWSTIVRYGGSANYCKPAASRLWSVWTMIYSLLIINKAGGLIYNREYNEGITRLSSNDYLVLAGTFHGSLSSASLTIIIRVPHNPLSITSRSPLSLSSPCIHTLCLLSISGR